MASTIEYFAYPFASVRPRDMKPLEQVFCMVWLAGNFCLYDLRQRQQLVEDQLDIAKRNNSCTEVIEDLNMMAENMAAAVAYQTFSDDIWMEFIH